MTVNYVVRNASRLIARHAIAFYCATRGGITMPHDGHAAEPSPDCVRFEKVFQDELTEIQARRARRESARAATSGGGARPEPSAQASQSSEAQDGLGPLSQSGKFNSAEPVLNAVGLSLSGGGIRSAAFCLGVLQA